MHLTSHNYTHHDARSFQVVVLKAKNLKISSMKGNGSMTK